MTRRMRVAAFLALGVTAALVVGCGGGDFPRKTTPPAPVELTGVILPGKVTISPDRTGAGPILITIANETNEAHTVTLEGTSVRERVGPIAPQDTATIQKTLSKGAYSVRAGSSVAVATPIRPGRLIVGRKRRNSNGQLLTP
jgi:hypothetical protein